jgi:hypothetical protein
MDPARDLALHQTDEGRLIDLTVSERRDQRRNCAVEQWVRHFFVQ